MEFSQSWTHPIGQSSDDDKCFLQDERYALEVSHETEKTEPFPGFKAKVALAAIQGDLTMAELVKKFDVQTNQVSDWKKQLLSNAPDVL